MLLAGAGAFYLWGQDPLLAQVLAAASICCGIVSLYPVGRPKFIACCSSSVTQALLDVGVNEAMLVCPLEGKLNHNFLMSRVRDYRFVVYDANPTSEGQMAVSDIQFAVVAAKAGANVIVRFDRSEYVTQGMIDRASAVEMLLNANQLKFVSTTQLQTLVTRYYGSKA